MKSGLGQSLFFGVLLFFFYVSGQVCYSQDSLQSLSTDELLNLGIATLLSSKNSMLLTNDQLKLLLENLDKSWKITEEEKIILEKSLILSESDSLSMTIIKEESQNLNDSSEKKENIITYSQEFLENSKKEERKRIIKLSLTWGGITVSVALILGGAFGWWLHSTLSK